MNPKPKRFLSFTILALTILVVSGCSSNQIIPTTSIDELTIEEYPLKFAPTTDPLSFAPEQASQNEVLAKHQQERDLPIFDHSILFEGRPVFLVQLGKEDLVAFETYTNTVTDQTALQKVTVQVLNGQQVIFSMDAGDVSPISNLRGLWTFSDHWVIEVAHVSLTPVSNETPLEPSGEIFLDGKSLTKNNGFDQTFGFQLMKGKPFFFFQQNGKIGIAFAGEQNRLDYDRILHYQCCSGAELNPRVAPNMVTFFAQRQDKWYFVEIGVFESQ